MNLEKNGGRVGEGSNCDDKNPKIKSYPHFSFEKGAAGGLPRGYTDLLDAMREAREAMGEGGVEPKN